MNVLLPLINDPDDHVRVEVRAALAEFPSEHTRSLFVQMLNSQSKPEDVLAGAYGLHSHGTNAWELLLEAWEKSTNRQSKAAVLSGFAFQENWDVLKNTTESRGGVYLGKRALFNNKALMMAWLLYADADAESVIEGVRSNISAGKGLPQVEDLIRSLQADLRQTRPPVIIPTN